MTEVRPRKALERPIDENDRSIVASQEPQRPDPQKEARKKRQTDIRKAYGRGDGVDTKRIKDRKLKGNLERLEVRYKDAARKAHQAEILLDNNAGFLEPEEELERTYHVRQNEIKAQASLETAKKGFELNLDELGPYRISYTRSGRDLLLAGRKGHLATMQWRDGKLGCELQLGETIRDATWLHNNQYFAVAQKESTYIYDAAGVEIHNLDRLPAQFLEFLPFHFLLVGATTTGTVRWTDTTMGETIASFSTREGPATAFAQNPYNAIVHVGHNRGSISLWSPNSQDPVVKLLPHHGPVRSIAVDREGRYMVSTGSEQRMAVWDIRMWKPINKYYLYQPGSAVAISDRNLTAVGWGTTVEVWRGLFDKHKDDQEKIGKPYLKWGGEGKRIESAEWCPFEDVLGIGHDKGFGSILVPGAGEPNFDALEVNPYETVKQRQEIEVRGLLNKIQPGMISLDPNFVGNLDLASHETRMREKFPDRKPEDDEQVKEVNKMRGRNTTLKRLKRKKAGKVDIIDEKRAKLEEMLEKQEKGDTDRLERKKEEYGPALARFARKES